MDMFKFGKGVKVHEMKVKRNIIITEDLSKVNSIVSFEENGEIVNLDAEGNEVLTPESFNNKTIAIRQSILKDLDEAISNIVDENVKIALQKNLEEIKTLPTDLKGQWLFDISLKALKDFALDLGAKVVAEIAMKQIGY